MFGVINKGANKSFRCGINRRSFATQVPTDSEFHNAKPYSEIPGPTFFQGVRSILPGGKFYKMEPYQVKALLKKEYGNILKLPGHFGRKDIIMSYDPKDFETVFRTEGSLPYRRPLLAVNYYRNNRPDAFVNKGLLNDQGEIWGQMRTVANPIMLKPKTVKNSIPAVDEVAMDFVAKIKAIADDKHEMPANFGVELGKWAFESIGVVALEHRLGVLTNEDDEESNKLIKSLRYLLHLGFQAEALPPIWMQTPIFSVLISSANVITDILKRYVDSAVDRMAKRQAAGEEDGHESILEKLVKANPDTAIVIAMDMLLAGIDTTTATISGLLYQLAKHPAKQEKLREEVMKILPNVDSKLTATSLNSTPYMRACIKESMRFSPPIPINMRAAGRNLVLQGYQIPKDTDVAMVGSIVQMDENHFSRSSEFLPERWLNGNDVMEGCPNNGRSDNAFTFLPFGFGARACIGKRIAEMELAVVVFRILREFKIEWHYGPLTYSQAFIVAPTNKLKFRMVPLK